MQEDRCLYDQLTAEGQAALRARWAERMDSRREALDLAAEFQAEGRSYAGLDENGRVVVFAPDGTLLGPPDQADREP